MDEKALLLEKISQSELAQNPNLAGLLGLWHTSRRTFPAAFLSFSTACQKKENPFGLFAVSAWMAEWGGKPLPADFQAKAPLASASFLAWAGKAKDGMALFAPLKPQESGKIGQLLCVYFPLLLGVEGRLPGTADFRSQVESVLKAEFGVTSEVTRKLLAEYDAGNFAEAVAGLKPALEQYFASPPFTSLDYLWVLFLSGIGKIEFAAVLEALSELEKDSYTLHWQKRQRAAGYLLLYFFLLRAGGESFDKAAALNPKFAKAVKNSQMAKKEKTELVELVKQFSVF